MGNNTVAALCVSRNSVYHTIEGVEAYDAKRDARTFPGGMPIVGHPPCRAWSAFCRHQAKPIEGEKELGLWCCDMLRQCGGVLEQPAFSHLFEAGGLPMPGESCGDLESVEVWQSWWGYSMSKRTWLCFSGVNVRTLEFPYRLHAKGGDGRRWQLMSKTERSATCRELALWLVDAAMKSRLTTALGLR